MAGGWGDDVYDIAGIHQLAGVAEAGDLIFFGYFFCNVVVGVVETSEFHRFDFFPVVQMKFTKVTDAKNTYFKHLLYFKLAVNLHQKGELFLTMVVHLIKRMANSGSPDSIKAYMKYPGRAA